MKQAKGKVAHICVCHRIVHEQLEFIDFFLERRLAQLLQDLVQAGGLACARVSAEVHQAGGALAEVAREELADDPMLRLPREHRLLPLLCQAPLGVRFSIE